MFDFLAMTGCKVRYKIDKTNAIDKSYSIHFKVKIVGKIKPYSKHIFDNLVKKRHQNSSNDICKKSTKWKKAKIYRIECCPSFVISHIHFSNYIS